MFAVQEIQIPSKEKANVPKSALEELLDKVIRAKLAEFEARLSLAEANAGKFVEEFEQVKGKTEVLESQNNEFYSKAYKKLLEMADELGVATKEVSALEAKISSYFAPIEELREQELHSVDRIKAHEKQFKKTAVKLRKQLAKQVKSVKEELLNRKFKEEVINAIKRDRVTLKKLTSAIKPKVRRIARAAARKTAESKAHEVATTTAKEQATTTATQIARKEAKKK